MAAPIKPLDLPGPNGLCWKQKTAKTPPFLNSMMRCTKKKGHEERGDPAHSWEWQSHTRTPTQGG